MTQTELSPKEICERGDEIYHRDLQSKLDTPENKRKILVIDIESGNYEMDEDKRQLEASRRLRARQPDGVFYFMRIGYPSMTKLGGGWGRHRS